MTTDAKASALIRAAKSVLKVRPSLMTEGIRRRYTRLAKAVVAIERKRRCGHYEDDDCMCAEIEGDSK